MITSIPPRAIQFSIQVIQRGSPIQPPFELIPNILHRSSTNVNPIFYAPNFTALNIRSNSPSNL